jgi:hypothetical protein
MIFTLDAGVSAKNASGVALLSPVGRCLVAAAVVRRDAKLDGLAAQYDIARKALSWLALVLPGFRTRLTVFAAEWPCVYPDERDVNPNTALLPLCGIIGQLSGMLPGNVRRATYLPREWKGTIDGDVTVERIRERLSDEERAALDAVNPPFLRHNAADAVGIGLHYLGRMGRRRAVHNEASL